MTQYEKGNYSAAVTLAKKCLELDPSYSNSYLVLGWAFYESGKYDDAIVNFKKYLSATTEKDDLSNSTHLYLSRAYKKLNNYDQSIYEINLFVMGTNPRPLILQEKAELYLDYERYLGKFGIDKLGERKYYTQKASELLDQLKEMKYKHIWFENDLGRLNLREGYFAADPDEKINFFNEAAIHFQNELFENPSKLVKFNLASAKERVAEVFLSIAWGSWKSQGGDKKITKTHDPQIAYKYFKKASNKYGEALELLKVVGNLKGFDVDPSNEINTINGKNKNIQELMNEISNAYKI